MNARLQKLFTEWSRLDAQLRRAPLYKRKTLSARKKRVGNAIAKIEQKEVKRALATIARAIK